MNSEKRIINFRRPFLIFVGIIIGIILSYSFFVNITLNKSVVLSVIISSLLLMALVLYFITYYFLKKKHIASNFAFRIINSLKNVIFITIAILLGVCLTLLKLQKYSTNKISGTYTIIASVENISQYDFGARLDLDNITLEDEDGEYIYDGNSSVFIENYYITDVVVGSTIKIKGEIVSNEVYTAEDVNKLINNSMSTIEFDKDNGLEIVATKVTLRSEFLNYVSDILHSNMSEDNANLAYGMLFGDKSGISNEVSSVFKTSGVMHLLAVSGLHVGIISGVIIFVIKKICEKTKLSFKSKWITIIALTSLFLLIYAYLCGFVASVTRASIMVIVYLVSQALGEKYDILSSLSVAGIIILLINPLSLLEIGFQLSFVCIFAIITLVPKFLELTRAIKIPNWLSSPLVISMSINLLIFPILINNFGEASIVSVLANLIVIPLFSIIFPILFVCLFIGMIPIFGFVLKLPDVLLQILGRIIDLFASIPYAVVSAFRVGYIVLAIILAFAFIWKYLMVRNITKIALLSSFAVICIIFMIFASMPATIPSNTIVVQDKYGYFNLVYSNDSLVMFGVPNKYTKDFLYDNKISTIDCLVVYDFSMKSYNLIKDFCSDYNVKYLCLDSRFEKFSDILDCNKTTIGYFDNNISFENYNFEVIRDVADNVLAITLLGHEDILYIVKDLQQDDYSLLGSMLNKPYEYVIIAKNDVELYNYDIIANNIICVSGDYGNNVKLRNGVSLKVEV